MLCGTIDIPDALLDAQLHDRLVVFCGAGVSIPPPSGMPTFVELVDEIAASVGASRQEEEEPDQCLGRIAEEKRFDVRGAVAERFTRPNSQPSALHRAAVGLFRDAAGVRLVTTNFDKHLTTALLERWPEGIAEYNAPALPLGDTVRGIVYVHGSITGDPSDMVVTDADFGRAYLTRGYARRFLLDCFRENTVLFIGYSHDDRIMQYLARGLPPAVPGGPSRFALAPESQRDKWKLLGIELLPYDPDGSPDERHAAVRETLEKWGDIARRDYTAHEREIEAIVSRGPDVDRESQDYLRRQVRDPVTVAFFCKAAKDPAWLGWLEDEPLFRDLFSPNAAPNDVGGALCRWFAEQAVGAPDEAQATVARMGGLLGTDLWFGVVRGLWRPRPAAEVLLSWLPILVASAPRILSDEFGYILTDCRPGEDDLFTIMLFDFLTEPSPFAKPDTFGEEGERHHKMELVARGESYWLSEAMEKVFTPRIEHFAPDLLFTATKNLSRGHDLLQAAGRATEGSDELSFWRSAIEPHPQDAQGQPDWVDVLVDAARTAIDWTVAGRPNLARHYLELWGTSRAPLLRRLAVYTMALAPWLDDDAKLAWVVGGDRLFASELRHEVFVALAKAYPGATDIGRQLVLDLIDVGLPPDKYADDPDLRDRVIFDTLDWLLAARPGDEELDRRMAAMRIKHPEFAPRPHPDMTHWLEVGWTPPPSAKSQDELLKTSPDDEGLLASLQSSEDGEGEWPPRIQRETFLAALGSAAVKDPAWSLLLAKTLVGKRIWTSDVWSALIDAWGETKLTEEQWSEALGLIASNSDEIGSNRATARLLEDAVRRDPPHLPTALLPLAEQIADALLADERTRSPEPPYEGANWIERAVNEPSGRIMMFFLHALALRQKDEAGVPLPGDFEARFNHALEGDTHADGLGRAVLGGQAHYLFARYPAWASRVLIPIFDWTGDPAKAIGTWQGFLTTGRPNPELAAALLPACRSTFTHLDDLGDLKAAFLTLLAYVGLMSPESPLSAGWIAEFLREASDEDIATWVGAMGQQLRAMPLPMRSEAWRTWLSSYCRSRGQDRTRPVSAAEVQELIGWIPDLPEDFVEASASACALPSSGAHRSFYHRFAKSGLVGQHPSEAARLLHHVLAGESRETPFWACEDAVAMALKLSEFGAPSEEVRAIRNELLRLRCRGAPTIPGES